MAKPRSDDEDDDLPDKRPASQHRRDDDEEEDPPRPRRKKSKSGALSGIIPYKNGLALLAYYLGFAGLIVILGSVALLKTNPGWVNPKLVRALMTGVGGFLALLAGIFGGIGLFHVSQHPEAKGTAHAITGIIMGALEILGLLVLLFILPTLLQGR